MAEVEASELGEARQILHALGKRLTGQRAILFKILQESQTHLDAEELYELARERCPRLNRATVYRNLTALKQSGLVETSYLGQLHPRGHFELRPEAEHYHFRCTQCGTVIEFEAPLVSRLKTQVTRQLGVALSNTILSFEGTCATCQESE